MYHGCRTYYPSQYGNQPLSSTTISTTLAHQKIQPILSYCNFNVDLNVTANQDVLIFQRKVPSKLEQEHKNIYLMVSVCCININS